MKTLSDVRTAFLEFFRRHGHEVRPSSSLVPLGDPTLMFANAGMNQFKNVFTGVERLPFVRAATSQKCVRAGGKHNDLDNVGYTARHHTFFEMLGNFSFGDYFKERAIEMAWDLLTKDYGLDPARLMVTVYHDDDVAWSHWKKLTGFPDHKIARIATSDNFWSMGDTGPCGPCSEIFYDHGEHIEGGPPGSPQADGDRFVEIWNLVFMQYEQLADGSRANLPAPSIDTGMGLERISAVLQGVSDNYEIDLFRNIIHDIQHEARNAKHEPAAYKVIADHLRSSCFLIADGVLPSNEGRGYVLRRIMRRAMRYAHQLGCKEPLMHRLVPSLVREMGEAYPELARAQAMIADNLRQEEERFKQTLERGLKLLEEESAALGSGAALRGDVAFKLYDTYGFPLDLTQDILRARGIAVDSAGFERCMNEQRERGREAWSGSGEKAVGSLWFDLKDKAGETEFVGYTQDECVAEVKAIVVDGEIVERATTGTVGLIILNRTPFYGESGGQVGDTGWILPLAGAASKEYKAQFPHRDAPSPISSEVLDTQKPLEHFYVHKVKLNISLRVGQEVLAVIDVARRDRIRANHSATHLLHKSLRDMLGDHVAQKGSLVAADRLRFDFSHPKALAREEIAAIERRVNEVIWHNTPVETREMSPGDAIKAGAMALFGEKYGERVRVLSMGALACDAAQDNAAYSVELCGGTHVRATGDVGIFKIVSESAVAAGVRRIEALTGVDAYDYLTQQESTLRALAESLKTPVAAVPERMQKLADDNRRLEKELAAAKKQIALGGGDTQKEMIGAMGFIARLFEDLPPKELRPLAEDLLSQAEPGVVFVGSGFEGKASLVVAVSQALIGSVSAVTLVQAAVECVGGKGGGGRPGMAQGGGPEAGKLVQAVEIVKKMLA